VEDHVVLNQCEEKLKHMGVNSQVLVEAKGVIFFEKFNNQANLATLWDLMRGKDTSAEEKMEYGLDVMDCTGEGSVVIGHSVLLSV